MLVSGFSDPKGGATANEKLAESRAAAVADALTKAGVPAARVKRRAIGGVDYRARTRSKADASRSRSASRSG